MHICAGAVCFPCRAYVLAICTYICVYTHACSVRLLRASYVYTYMCAVCFAYRVCIIYTHTYIHTRGLCVCYACRTYTYTCAICFARRICYIHTRASTRAHCAFVTRVVYVHIYTPDVYCFSCRIYFIHTHTRCAFVTRVVRTYIRALFVMRVVRTHTHARAVCFACRV